MLTYRDRVADYSLTGKSTCILTQVYTHCKQKMKNLTYFAALSLPDASSAASAAFSASIVDFFLRWMMKRLHG